MSAAEDAVKNFTKQYYNSLSSGLSLSPATLQLAQGMTTLGATSQDLWQFFDSLPPDSIDRLFNPGQMNSFASTYGAVIANLVPQVSTSEKDILGDDYAAWVAYKQAYTEPANFDWNQPDASQKLNVLMLRTFGRKQGLDQSKINGMVAVLGDVDFVSAAKMRYTAAGPEHAYTVFIDDVKAKLDTKRPKTITLNSKTTSSDTSKSWASAKLGGFYKIFSGSASGDWSRFTENLASSGFDLTLTFDSQETVTGGPYDLSFSSSANLAKYKPWYSGAVLANAYKTNDYTMWQPKNPTWDSTFGPQGNLQRSTVGLVVVNGITSTITSKVDTSSVTKDSIKTAAKFGIWPFFSAEGEGGWTHDVTLTDSGDLTVKSVSAFGRYHVIGFIVQSMANQFNKK